MANHVGGGVILGISLFIIMMATFASFTMGHYLAVAIYMLFTSIWLAALLKVQNTKIYVTINIILSVAIIALTLKGIIP